MMCGLLALLLCGGCWVFAWKHLRRRIDERFDVLSEHLERHAAECPIRKEHLLASCLPADPERKGNGSFHRSFRASYPGFLPTLRERVPGITPAEETLCMLIKMNLSNREIADKMSISIGSLHTTRVAVRLVGEVELRHTLGDVHFRVVVGTSREEGRHHQRQNTEK